MKILYKYQRFYLKYILSLLFLSVVYTADCQNIYNQSFKDINGVNVSLQGFSGKKILFIILPFNAGDSLVAQLKIFVTTYGEKVQVVGVLSQEDGYSEAIKADLRATYQNSGVLVTDVMGTRKGNAQSPLMKWLTNNNENGHFDMDVKGPGQKFFVNEQGKLYAVLGQLPLSSPFINKIVNATETSQ